MQTEQIKKTERQYYIDWMRILLIMSVFLFHIGMIFNSWDWHIKNDQTYGGGLKYIMIHLHYWRMPLLFLISGAGTYFALGKRRPGQYLGERFKRLFIPLAAGIFILVPIQVYIEKSASYDSLLSFYPHIFEGIYPSGNFSWHHLWFIAYLFVIALLISPFLNFLRSEGFSRSVRYLELAAARPLGLNVIMVPLLLSQAFLRPYFPESTHGLIDDWASMALYIVFFLSGFILLSNNSIVESIRKQRFLFLGESIAFSTMLFTIPYMVNSDEMANLLWDNLSYFVAWSCGIAAIGFSRQHLNFNSLFRKLANEAIYPFYLLHQPVIVLLGSYIVQWDVSVVWKLVSVTIASLLVTTSLYWFLVRPFNGMRLIFGMKMLPLQEKREVRTLVSVFAFQGKKAS